MKEQPAINVRSIPTEQEIEERVGRRMKIMAGPDDPHYVHARVAFYQEVRREIDKAGVDAMALFGLPPGATNFMRARGMHTRTFRPLDRNLCSAESQLRQLAGLAAMAPSASLDSICILDGPLLTWVEPISDLAYARQLAMTMAMLRGNPRMDRDGAEMGLRAIRVQLQQALDTGVDMNLIEAVMADCIQAMHDRSADDRGNVTQFTPRGTA